MKTDTVHDVTHSSNHLITCYFANMLYSIYIQGTAALAHFSANCYSVMFQIKSPKVKEMKESAISYYTLSAHGHHVKSPRDQNRKPKDAGKAC